MDFNQKGEREAIISILTKGETFRRLQSWLRAREQSRVWLILKCKVCINEGWRNPEEAKSKWKQSFN